MNSSNKNSSKSSSNGNVSLKDLHKKNREHNKAPTHLKDSIKGAYSKDLKIKSRTKIWKWLSDWHYALPTVAASALIVLILYPNIEITQTPENWIPEYDSIEIQSSPSNAQKKESKKEVNKQFGKENRNRSEIAPASAKPRPSYDGTLASDKMSVEEAEVEPSQQHSLEKKRAQHRSIVTDSHTSPKVDKKDVTDSAPDSLASFSSGPTEFLDGLEESGSEAKTPLAKEAEEVERIESIENAKENIKESEIVLSSDDSIAAPKVAPKPLLTDNIPKRELSHPLNENSTDQSDNNAFDEEIEEVIVTGSRIIHSNRSESDDLEGFEELVLKVVNGQRGQFTNCNGESIELPVEAKFKPSTWVEAKDVEGEWKFKVLNDFSCPN